MTRPTAAVNFHGGAPRRIHSHVLALAQRELEAMVGRNDKPPDAAAGKLADCAGDVGDNHIHYLAGHPVVIPFS